jgi:hypothetical protein
LRGGDLNKLFSLKVIAVVVTTGATAIKMLKVYGIIL